MKICFLGWADSVHLERWAGYFARQGHDVTVISFSGRGQYPEGVRQYLFGQESRVVRWKMLMLKLRYLLWRLKPDLVHVHWAAFAHLAVKAWSGPLVVTAWGSDIYGVNEELDQTSTEKENLISGLKAAHIITCDSEDLAKHIQEIRGAGHNNVHIIQWGVDTRRFYPANPDPGLLSDLEVTGRPVVFSPRKFRPVYNQETVLSAFALVLSRVPDAMLVMKNSRENRDSIHAIKTRINDLGLKKAVRIIGLVPYERMSDLYRMAAVTVSVPLSDSTPMTLLEAMACGSVPIVSDLPSLREWIQDRWNGYVVPVRDTRRLAERIIHILENPEMAAEYARRNRKIVEDRASLDVNMRRMTDIYRNLIDNIASQKSEETIRRRQL